MMSKGARFLNIDQTPLPSRGGWMIPKPYYAMFEHDIKEALEKLGFKEGSDFTIVIRIAEVWDKAQSKTLSVRLVHRVMFHNEELFTMAKMIYE